MASKFVNLMQKDACLLRSALLVREERVHPYLPQWSTSHPPPPPPPSPPPPRVSPARGEIKVKVQQQSRLAAEDAPTPGDVAHFLLKKEGPLICASRNETFTLIV